MDGRFDPRLTSIFVYGTILGPAGQTRVRLAVDTGSTRTIIRASVLSYIGYDLTKNVTRSRMTTATGVQLVPILRILPLSALNHTTTLIVAAVELPATFDGHGLLGRDFFEGRVLTIDFVKHTITLRRPRWWAFWR